MPFLRILLLALALAAPVAAKKPAVIEPPPAPTQDAVAKDFIYHILTGKRDSVAALFEEVLRPQITQEVVDGIQGQFKWLYNFIGGDFELFMSGPGQGDSSFFREYRMANETNKRSPLIIIQVVYPDSVTPQLIGAQVKSFVGGSEKRVAGEQTWIIGGRTYDLHSIIVVETPSQGSLMAVQYYDEDTAVLTHETVSRNGLPLLREAIARGYLDSAKVTAEGKPLSEDIGVVFIRREPREGLVHVKVSFRPEDYGMIGKATRDSIAAAQKPKAKPAGKPAGKKK